MYDLDEQERDDTSLIVPDGIEGNEGMRNWFTDRGVHIASSHYHKLCSEEAPLAQIKIAERFVDQVTNGYKEAIVGASPQVKRQRKSTMLIADNVQKINGHLSLTTSGDRQRDIQIDLGDERLNHFASVIINQISNSVSNSMSLMEARINRRLDGLESRIGGLESRIGGLESRIGGLESRFDGLESRFDGLESRFDGLESRFDGLEESFENLRISQMNESIRFENGFKGEGGDESNRNAYGSIVNSRGEYLQDSGFAPLTSLDQINSLSSTAVSQYLRFYGVTDTGYLEDKRKRLIRYLGINIETREVVGVI